MIKLFHIDSSWCSWIPTRKWNMLENTEHKTSPNRMLRPEQNTYTKHIPTIYLRDLTFHWLRRRPEVPPPNRRNTSSSSCRRKRKSRWASEKALPLTSAEHRDMLYDMYWYDINDVIWYVVLSCCYEMIIVYNLIQCCSYMFLFLFDLVWIPKMDQHGGIEGPLRTWHRLAAAKPQRNPPARINRK